MFGQLRGFVIAAAACAPLVVGAPAAAQNGADAEDLRALSMTALLERDADKQVAALNKIVARANPDMIPTLVFFMRMSGDNVRVAHALSELAGEPLRDWHAAATWLEANPQITPHESYTQIKLGFWRNIDPNFLRFFEGGRLDADKMKIRFEEIMWGGVQLDGIPSLDNPNLIPATDADYLLEDDLVFGVEINGDARAYPLRIMGWHEMFNETIGGVPVALAYCTLCGAGILFETHVAGRERPFVFGSSGFLFRSNKLMFDRETYSLWNQFTGEPVVGPLVDQGVRLKIRPVAVASWKDWREAHPETQVLSLETGYFRNYDSGFVYKDYFASPDLMFPARVRDETRLKRKDYVFGVRAVGASKAWPLDVFEQDAVINDEVGRQALVLLGDAATRTVRAYERADRQFEQADGGGLVDQDGGAWRVEEEALFGPGDARLPRVPGHIAYWFAWENYFGPTSELYGG